MPPNSVLEWFAGGNLPRKKRAGKAGVVQLVAPQEPEPAAKHAPATNSAPKKKPVSTTTKPKVTSKSEMPKQSCSCGSCKPYKKVRFKDPVLKSAMKKGTEKATLVGEKTKHEERTRKCKCRVCGMRDATVASSSDGVKKWKPERERESECDCAAKIGGKQNKQTFRQHNRQLKHQNTNRYHNNNYTQPRESQGYPQSEISSGFDRRNMSYLIQPSRAEVVVREDVIECPSDPKPNAFFDASIGVLRVYHGPHYGNAFGGMAPFAGQGISIGSTMGSRMPMPMGGNFMGGPALGMNQAAPMASGAYGGWPGLAQMNDPSNDPHWTAVSGPGAQWPGMHKGSGQSRQSGGYSGFGMRGGYGRGDGGQQRGENAAGNSKNWSNYQQGNNCRERKNQNQNSRSGNNDQNRSAGGDWGGSNNFGDGKDNRNNSEASNEWDSGSNNSPGNGDWCGNDCNGDNDHWDNYPDNNANDDPNSHQDNADAFANLPGSWNDDDDGNNDNDNDNGHSWHQPATPPSRTANQGSNEHNWGRRNDASSNSNANANANNRASPAKLRPSSNSHNPSQGSNSSNPSRSKPRPASAHNRCSQQQQQQQHNSCNSCNQRHRRNGDGDGDGDGNGDSDGSAWGPPAEQAPWADPSMAAATGDWQAGEQGGGGDGDGGGGGGGGGDDDRWR